MTASNWITDLTGEGKSGWAGCPHCRAELRKIFLSVAVRSDIPFFALEGRKPMCANPGTYEAQFNPQGAASVVLEDGRALGMRPSEFRWLAPVPPYDRWCKGKGGLHQ